MTLYEKIKADLVEKELKPIAGEKVMVDLGYKFSSEGVVVKSPDGKIAFDVKQIVDAMDGRTKPGFCFLTDHERGKCFVIPKPYSRYEN
jgi:hypothetical protein